MIFSHAHRTIDYSEAPVNNNAMQGQQEKNIKKW